MNFNIIATSVGGTREFEKPIPKEYDQDLNLKIRHIIKMIASIKVPIFLYMAVGTANKCANGTNFSVSNVDIKFTNFMNQQQKPKIIDDAIKNGYFVVAINIDDFDKDVYFQNESMINFMIKGVFPLSGKCCNDGTKENSESLDAINELFNIVYKNKGQVVLVNAVENSTVGFNFRLFTGMEMVLAGDKFSMLTYATSFWFRQEGADTDIFFVYKKCRKSFLTPGLIKSSTLITPISTNLTTMSDINHED